jgi:hypothetical protein
MPWSKMLLNNQSTITVDSPRQQKPMFRGEHNGPGHFTICGLLGVTGALEEVSFQ